ncbi:MAG: DUF433 domain-containing protein [Phycisphaerales bacterium]|nr:DUF433 domain-containing protein [Phycisphaerales bacterium]
MRREFLRQFSRNKRVMGGETVMAGTRVPLRTVLANLAAGLSERQILREYPSLTAEHVRAAIVFAAESAREDLPPGSSAAA